MIFKNNVFICVIQCQPVQSSMGGTREEQHSDNGPLI